jgi:hypothetical protein
MKGPQRSEAYKDTRRIDDMVEKKNAAIDENHEKKQD